MKGEAAAATGGAAVGSELTGHLRDLLLSLADNKRLLGIRYSDCMLGSPSLETGIAAASMAQDEWGHSRLTYALLSDFGDDPIALERERDSASYRSMESLDLPFGGYIAFVAAALLIDGALTEQYRAMAASRYEPIRNRVQKVLEEEALHARFAAAWAEKLSGQSTRQEFSQYVSSMLNQALRWFGPEDNAVVSSLLERGYVDAGPNELRRRLLDRVGPVLDRCGLAEELSRHDVDGGTEWRYMGALDWTGWVPGRRRAGGGGPDAETLGRVRGDRNRALLIDT